MLSHTKDKGLTWLKLLAIPEADQSLYAMMAHDGSITHIITENKMFQERKTVLRKAV